MKSLRSPAIFPLLVGVGDLGVTMKEAPKAATHARKHERQKEDAQNEEGNLRHDRNEDADDAQNEEEDRPGQILGPAPSLIRLALPDPHVT